MPLMTQRGLAATGKSLNPVQPPLQKNSTSRLPQISNISLTVLSHRGALRNVINAGRDAVDADALKDERRLRRTAKSCGPDAPTLESSWRSYLRRRRWQKSPVTGESTKETVKTIARGMPGDSGVTVVTTCRFTGVDRKSPVCGQTGAIDP